MKKALTTFTARKVCLSFQNQNGGIMYIIAERV